MGLIMTPSFDVSARSHSHFHFLFDHLTKDATTLHYVCEHSDMIVSVVYQNDCLDARTTAITA